MKKCGFTLIELLAVIIILAIIALIATPIILNVIVDARKSAGMSEAKMIYSAVNEYCATSAMKSQLDGSLDICADGVSIDEVNQMVQLGNARVTKIAYGDGKITELIVESNTNEYTLQADGNFSINGIVEEPIVPTVNITYDKNKVNTNGWTKEDIVVTITGEGNLKYCLSDTSCEPSENVTGTITISNEGTNYLCALASNSSSNSSKECITIKLDKSSPSLTAISENVSVYEGDSNNVNNYFNVNYSISGGTMSCVPVNTNILSAGTQTVTCTATGGNGNTATASKTITVRPKQYEVTFTTSQLNNWYIENVANTNESYDWDATNNTTYTLLLDKGTYNYKFYNKDLGCSATYTINVSGGTVSQNVSCGSRPEHSGDGI